MSEAPRSFWTLAGVGLLVVCIAFAVKILLPNSSAGLDVEGIRVSVTSAEQGISAAQAALTQARAQNEALSRELSEANAQIAQLAATVENSPQLARSEASRIRAQRAQRPTPAQGPAVDTSLFDAATRELARASKSVAAAQAQLAPRK